ncbi:hypothetical protein [Burkholderia sp. AU15512]|uniref:hypothetical protein n=1 Tax=Burkholderia sp. AU15512 TaxID=2015345 RepID=UPI000B7A124B|nr:hypothetical protein [Burkholderia sp. AU15512]OXI24364.1 hypothetical protein CFB43_06620 [Burkholderia sp. AU15512]
MPLDPSIPLQFKTAEFNPLQQALQVAQFRAINASGQAQQQQLAANQAASEAFKQSTDANGNTDYNKFRSIMASGAGAYNLPQINNSILDAQQKQATLTGTNLDQAMKTQSALRQGLGSLLTKPDLSPQDVMNFGVTQLQAGAITPQVFQAEMQSMPSDPQALRGWLQQHYMSALSGETQLNAMMPKYAQVNTGPATVAVNQNPLAAGGGVGTVGYTVQNGLSPSEALAPGLTLNKNGQPTTYTKGQMAGGQVPQVPGGGYATGAPLGASDVASGAATRYNTLQTAASQAKPMMQTYDLANQAVQGAIAAGKGAGPIASAGGVVQTLLGALGQKPTGDSVKDYQLAVSYLNSAADQAAQSLGLSGSDARVAAAKAGQPDPNNMNLPALQESIAHAKGLQQALLDRQQATTNFLAQNGNNTSQLPQFEAKWNQSFNPDVSYIRSLADPAAQQAAMQQLKAQGKLQSWMKDYQAMKALGAF